MSGQVNFYRPFIGVLDAADGTFLQTVVFDRNAEEYKLNIGYASFTVDVDSAGNMYTGINY